MFGNVAEYVGCFLRRNAESKLLKMRDHRWYDPHHEVMEGDNTYYAEGAFYAVSGRLTDGIIKSGLTPRLGGSEGMQSPLLMPGGVNMRTPFHCPRGLTSNLNCITLLTDAVH